MESRKDRRNYTCEISGQVGGKLSIHHLKSYAKYPELRMIKSNVIVIRKDLHEEFHRVYGRHNFTEENFWEFIKNDKN